MLLLRHQSARSTLIRRRKRRHPHYHLDPRRHEGWDHSVHLHPGGSDYRDADVTAVGSENRAENGAMAGALFRLDLGTHGTLPFPYHLTTQ
jgi:hypothetical protein